MKTLQKKTYSPPLIESYSIDHEISLVMMTSETEIPVDPRGAAAAPTSSSFKENPFEERK